MLLLILFYISFFSGPWNTVALPTDLRPSETLPRNHLQSIFIREEDRFDNRSIYGILWSCLSTIFACTWVTVHPNMPAPGDSKWAVLRRRVAIMGYFLLAPEFVIMWAARQHFGARSLTKEYSTKHPGWTRAHSFFLIMGGFTLYKEGKPISVLEAKELADLSKEGKVTWPTITEEEIADRSKGDYLSKTIALFQTAWFIGQCIARGAYGLTVTELEVVTVAFASLTGVIYYLWWDKPLDVRCSIPVHLLPGEDNNIHRSNPLPRVDPSTPNLPPTSARSLFISSPEVSDEAILQMNEKIIDPPPSTPARGTATPDQAFTRIQRFRNFRRNACEDYGTFLGLTYVFVVFPLIRFFRPFQEMLDCKDLKGKILRVPTFYSVAIKGDDEDLIPLIPAACVSVIFGAIHCIAWDFHFATWQEQWLWRISAILVSGLPISMLALAGLGYLLDHHNNGEIHCGGVATFIAIFIQIFLYVVVRIILLVLPFIALRSLPPGAYIQPNWVSFLPHI